MPINFILTNAGKAAMVAANNAGTATVTISTIALGTASWLPTAAATALSAEVKRFPAIGGGAVADDTIHVTGSDSSSSVYEAKEVGLYTSGGVLLAIYSQPTAIITKGAATVALLSVDLVLTGVPPGTITVGDTTFEYPPATEGVKGVAYLATIADAHAGLDDTKILTIKKMQEVKATDTRSGVVKLATAAEVAAGVDAVRAITPATLAALSATEQRAGLIEIATIQEVQTGTDAARAITPLSIKSLTATSARYGLLKSATTQDLTNINSDSSVAITPPNIPALTTLILQAIYPVGSILITVNPGSPHNWLGFGNWERWGAGRTLIGVDPTDPQYDYAGYTGGEAAVTLGINEMPNHSHGVPQGSGYTSADGNHAHNYTRRLEDGGSSNFESMVVSSNADEREIQVQTSFEGTHGHSVTVNPNTTHITGEGYSHNNIPPYITTNIWRRAG